MCCRLHKNNDCTAIKPEINNIISYVLGVHPLSAQAPRTVVESAVPTSTQPTPIKSENVRSVILDPKDDVLVLDDIKVGMGISSNKHDLGGVRLRKAKLKNGRLVTWMFSYLDRTFGKWTFCNWTF